MAFLTQRFIQAALKSPAAIRATEERIDPEVVVLPVRERVTPSDKPPVRIFLGTETAQYKAERVFIWSIEQVRDPARVYEIYLMKHLFGFRSRFWLTGFTNYRFAIPHFAGGTGRAIYNDVDQIYLKDPAELFDLDMGNHAYLAIVPGDISVALLDCERMSQVWSLHDAQTGRKNPLLARASSGSGMWGELAGSWNARDLEYVPGESGVLHYTVLHRQPWHPFPGLFAYHANPSGNIWFDLEQSADEVGFQVFSADSPSRAYKDLCDIVEDAQAQTSGATLIGVDLGQLHETLEFVPDDDVPWLLAAMFARTETKLFCDVYEGAPDLLLPNGVSIRRRRRTPEWWQYQFEIVARRHPSVHWRLSLHRDQSRHRERPLIIQGNECSQGAAVVWVLASKKPGHTAQAIALAESVGWPHEIIKVPQSLSAMLRVMLRRNSGQVAPLRPPWPNVVVACGWWPTRVARWIQMRSGGQVRLLLGGRKCGPVKSPTDILVSCKHFHLPTHVRRIELLLPAHPVTQFRLEAALERGQQIMADAAEPRVALLVGGSSKQHQLTVGDAASLGRRVLEQTRAAGGSLFAVTSRRTGSKAATALSQALQGAAKVHIWSPNEKDNPYLSYLAAADVLVVTGESESMLMDAIATGKPVYIYPLRQRRYGPWFTLGAKLVEWSERRPKNRRGTERPQQGFEYLCSRLLKREWILPPRDLDGLHRDLVESGLARMFDDSISTEAAVRTTDTGDLGRRLRVMLAQVQDDVPVDRSFANQTTAEV